MAATRKSSESAADRRRRREEARARLKLLREKLHHARAAKKHRAKEWTAEIRAARVALRDRLRENRQRFLDELRTWEKTQRGEARAAWLEQRRVRQTEARTEIERVRGELAAERAHEREERRVAAAARVRAVAHRRGLQKQTDAEVRALLPASLLPLFQKWSASVRAKVGQSRAETFLALAEQRPDDVVRHLEPHLERAITETVRALHETKRAAAKKEALPKVAGLLPREAPANRNAKSPATLRAESEERARLERIEATYQAKKAVVRGSELREPKDIAKRIKADIQAAMKAGKLPKASYRVRSESYTNGGASIDVLASKLPFPVLNRAAFVVDPGANFMRLAGAAETRFTAKAKAVEATLKSIVDAYHWDRSDLVSDYHHERFMPAIRLDEGSERGEIERALVQAAKAKKGRST